MSYLGPRIPPAALTLDLADPINRGLIAFWPLSHLAGNVARDLTPRRRNGTLVGFAADRFAASLPGKVLKFNGTSNYINANGRWLAGLSQGAVCVRARINSGNGYLYYEDGSGFNNFALRCPAPGTSALEFNIGSNATRNSTARAWASDAWYDVAITWASDVRVYINGVLDNTIAVSVSTSSSAGDNDQIGRYSYGGGIGGGYTPASISSIRLFRRAPTAAEIARLSRNPWAGIRAPRTAFWWVGGTSAGTLVTLTGSVASTAAGTVAPGISMAATGSATTGSSGTPTATIGTSPTGAATTASAGTATSGIGMSVAGSAVTVSSGSLAYTIGFVLTGTASSAAGGSVSSSGADVLTSRSLTGIRMTALPGNVRVTGGTRWSPSQPQTVTPPSMVGNTLQPPPRLTGDANQDMRMQHQWLQTLYDQQVKVLNILGRVLDHESRIASLEASNDNQT